MNEFQFAGAKWWKFDCHIHTRASDDVSDEKMTHKSWLKAFMGSSMSAWNPPALLITYLLK